MIPMGVDITVIEKRQDFGVIAFKLHLMKRQKIGNVYTILGKVVSQLQKQQRRHFFRVKLYLDMEIAFLQSTLGEPLNYYVFDPDTVEDEEKVIKVTLSDISGGGFGVRSRMALPEGTYVYSRLNFLSRPVEIVGTIVRSRPSEKYPGEYELGIAFEDLSPEARREITSYVFRKQQDHRRKERDDEKN
jgi:c-di-GMP-binding flagellar brake protein YcgR